jgi:uncharacterized membrane protein YciS (DUF1049 family)
VRPWSPALWSVILRAVTWALVTVSFILAAAVFRDEALPKVLGILLAIGVVLAWLSPKFVRGPETSVR